VLGINDRAQLAAAERLMREQINTRLMLNGVTLIDPANTYIEASVTIGPDTVVHPGSHIAGRTVIGRECAIGPNTIIEDSQIGNRVEIVASLIESATVETRRIGRSHTCARARICARVSTLGILQK
jgi:bifunctional UDP-N-acetylglucosamine pyrophosphorylase/glucosamine-1-phosphate N-acetyltransferase